MYKVKFYHEHGAEMKIIIRENVDGSVTSFGEYEGNTDYQQYLEWLADGNEPLPAEE